MKKHKNLKELLEDFLTKRWQDMCFKGLSTDDKRFINDYLSSNCLVSGKQRPLAKNKQCEDDLCNCKINHEFMLTDGDIYVCCGCKKPIA